MSDPSGWVDPLGLAVCPARYGRYKELRAKGLTAKEATLASKSPKEGLPVPENLATNIHNGAQGKHIAGHNNFDPKRSPLKADPQELLNGVHSGKYPIIRMTTGQPPKPIVNFKKPIGNYVDIKGLDHGPTNFGQISTKRLGAHIIPANPNQF